MTQPTPTYDDALARRNAIVLALAQALGGGNTSVLIATGGIVGAMLAPSKVLATLPVSCYVIGLWLGTLPLGFLSRRLGRRTAFQIGAASGVLTGFLATIGVVIGSFAVFCLGSVAGGFYAAAMQGYRFAAADTASPTMRPKVVSWVLVGGVASGIVGPQLIIQTKDLWPPFLFAPTFVAQAILAIFAMLMLIALRAPPVTETAATGPVRPLWEIARQPRFIAAVVSGIASYGTMNLVMTSAPLAMLECNLSISDAALGLQWHVIAMYFPSFFTGSLILRFGVDRIVLVGFALTLLSSAVGLSGTTVWHFWTVLVLLGAGWNFAFVGATTMVTECYRPQERTIVQPFNDFLVFGSMVVGSLSSGALIATVGWDAVNMLVVPVVAAALVLMAVQAIGRLRAGA